MVLQCHFHLLRIECPASQPNPLYAHFCCWYRRLCSCSCPVFSWLLRHWRLAGPPNTIYWGSGPLASMEIFYLSSPPLPVKWNNFVFRDSQLLYFGMPSWWWPCKFICSHYTLPTLYSMHGRPEGVELSRKSIKDFFMWILASYFVAHVNGCVLHLPNCYPLAFKKSWTYLASNTEWPCSPLPQTDPDA